MSSSTQTVSSTSQTVIALSPLTSNSAAAAAATKPSRPQIAPTTQTSSSLVSGQRQAMPTGQTVPVPTTTHVHVFRRNFVDFIVGTWCGNLIAIFGAFSTIAGLGWTIYTGRLGLRYGELQTCASLYAIQKYTSHCNHTLAAGLTSRSDVTPDEAFQHSVADEEWINMLTACSTILFTLAAGTATISLIRPRLHRAYPAITSDVRMFPALSIFQMSRERDKGRECWVPHWTRPYLGDRAQEIKIPAAIFPEEACTISGTIIEDGTGYGDSSKAEVEIPLVEQDLDLETQQHDQPLADPHARSEDDYESDEEALPRVSFMAKSTDSSNPDADRCAVLMLQRLQAIRWLESKEKKKAAPHKKWPPRTLRQDL